MTVFLITVVIGVFRALGKTVGRALCVVCHKVMSLRVRIRLSVIKTIAYPFVNVLNNKIIKQLVNRAFISALWPIEIFFMEAYVNK
ncbi:hypothetical protein [Psychrobacter sp. CAL346-MNA-CIBAN-0220]|uniref:hypothetical protein n=1 Tax=Psychrobacter sp. CAL346-MNA-CIBAN-0220 TaxID=3140457 RepID=UPI00332F50BD